MINHEPLEGLLHEQHANEFNSAQNDVDRGYAKRECEIETEKYSEVLHAAFFGTLTRRCRMLRKFKEFQRFEPQATRMFYGRRMVMSNRTIDRKCTLRKRGKERPFLTK